MPQPALDRDAAVMCLNDGFDDEQPDPGPRDFRSDGIVGPEETIEEVGDIFRSDPDGAGRDGPVGRISDEKSRPHTERVRGFRGSK